MPNYHGKIIESKIIALRKKINWSQVNMAKKIGCSLATYRIWEYQTSKKGIGEKYIRQAEDLLRKHGEL